MCGIFGYLGKRRDAAKIVFEGLKRLEYRGYDSWGVAVKNGKKIDVDKHVGKISKAKLGPKFLKIVSEVAIGHCLAGDTIVQLSNGELKAISEIRSGEKVCTVNLDNLVTTNTQSAVAWKHDAPKELLEVKTPFFTFQATPAHKLFVSLPNGHIVTREVEKLSGEELLPIVGKIRLKGGKPFVLKTVKAEKHFLLTDEGRKVLRAARKRLNLTRKELERRSSVKEKYIEGIETGRKQSIEDIRLQKLMKALNLKFDFKLYRSVNFKTNDVFLPKKSSPALLQIIGYHLGDGYYDKRFARYKDTSYDVIQSYKNLYHEVFNLRGRVETRENYYILVFNSRFLIEWSRVNFPEILSATGKKDLPPFIGTLPRSQIAHFLKGIFDAEGTVATSARQVRLSMVDKIVVQKLQLLLLRFGILSTFSKNNRGQRNEKDSFSLLINDKDSVVKFGKAINFASKEKSEKLKVLVNSMKDRNYKFFKVPMRGDKLLPELATLEMRGEYSPSYFTNYKLKKIFLRAKGKNLLLYHKIKKFLDSDIVWSRFTTKRIKPEGDFVYDLEVPGVSNFIGNGILQHNSRWATHGGVTEANAHPHLDCSGKIAVVHNGIVENWQDLKKSLSKRHQFVSETDTEVIAHMIEQELGVRPLIGVEPLKNAVRKVFLRLSGLNAIVVMGDGQLIAAKNGSPLVVGIGEGEFLIASDAAAIIPHTNQVVFLKDNQMAVVLQGGVGIFDLELGKKISYKMEILDWKREEADLGKFKHFMLKEIYEQPAVLRNIAENYVEDVEKLGDLIKRARGTFLIGAGTAFHACLAGSYLFSKIAKLHVNTIIASEFNYLEDFLTKESLVIALSQSGETIDVVEPIKRAKKKGAKIAALVNNVGSTIWQMADYKVALCAGPEMAVASTKAYIAKLAILLLTVFGLTGKPDEGRRLLLRAADEVERLLFEETENLKKITKILAGSEHIFTIGRGLSYQGALEAALKMKEVSYVHTEGLAGGELKHGPIALIATGTPCIVFAPSDETYEAIISNATEIKSRGGVIIGISPQKSEVFDFFVKVADLGEASIIPVVIPAQLFGYYMAVEKGFDPDKPRNLAKSVTVK